MRSIRRASCLVRASGSVGSPICPFGAGPRACIGASFAMQEMIIMLATIVRSFRLDVAPNHQTWPMNHVTLRPRGGLPMILQRRLKGGRRGEAMQTQHKSG